MRLSATLLAGTALAFTSPAIAAEAVTTAAQDTAAPGEATVEPAADAAPVEEVIVVTARKREESLQDVPVAVTAVTGDTIEKRGLVQIKDVAALTPSLNVNSDSVGRVFIAIRGIGTTLVGTVQPGVGIFVDGIYQPNTSYLNNPLVDVERVEVLRGPQGTLYGKNTLGGAINVITRQPSNLFEGKVGGSYAGPDHAWNAFASVSGPIIEDKLQIKIAAAHREQDGFIRNEQLGTDANSMNMDSLAATIRAEPVQDVVLTIKGYYDWVKGGNIPYSHIDGPTDYSRTVDLSAENTQYFDYKGGNAKLQFGVSGNTNVTLIGAYDQRDGRSPDFDADFNAFNFVRQKSTDTLKTTNTELRFDTEWSEQFSSLFGLFYSHETVRGTSKSVSDLSVLPAPLTAPATVVDATLDRRKGDTYAAFGTLFWKPSPEWEAAFGLRLDREKRTADGALGSVPLIGTIGLDLDDAPDVPLTTPVAEVKIKSTNLLPRLTLTRHWSPDLMSYASVSRGFRGGGFNGPNAPFRTYDGDSAWSYELGTKYALGRQISLAGAVFYNDYKNFIGLNNFVTGNNGRPATVDLNTGDVKSYGIEAELMYRPTRNWTLTGGASYIHARIQNFDGLRERTATILDPDGIALASKRLPFQPDWTANLNSDYVIPAGNGELTFSAGVVAKGSRVGASLSETRSPVLKSYALVNTALTYSVGGTEVGAFINNLFNADYMESFIERTTLAGVFGPLADPATGEPLASDLGIAGDKRRYGVRARYKF